MIHLRLVEVHGVKAEERVEHHQNEQQRQMQLENLEYFGLVPSKKIQP
jgi:hypothetical protein